MHHSKKEQLIDLWRSCFRDSEDFIRLFFERVYREEWALTIEEEGEVISVLYLIPYRMNWEGQEINVGYICGAGTLPSRRGEGLMGRLLHDAREVMRQRQMDLAVLIPAEERLFDYYRQYGYTEAFFYSLIQVKSNIPSPQGLYYFHRIDETKLGSWYPFFDRMMRRRPCCLLHGKEDFEHNYIDTLLDGGQLYGITNPLGQQMAMAFIIKREGEIYCKELFYDNKAARDALLSRLFRQMKLSKLLYKTPVTTVETGQRYGMAMAVNRTGLAKRWLDRHPESELSEADLFAMELPAFTRLMLGYEQREAYMSLMLDS